MGRLIHPEQVKIYTMHMYIKDHDICLCTGTAHIHAVIAYDHDNDSLPESPNLLLGRMKSFLGVGDHQLQYFWGGETETRRKRKKVEATQEQAITDIKQTAKVVAKSEYVLKGSSDPVVQR